MTNMRAAQTPILNFPDLHLTHKIIYEAEKRVGKKKKDTEKYTKDKWQ